MTRWSAALNCASLIVSVGVKLEKEGIEVEQARHHENAAIAVLNVGGVDDGVHQQALGIDKDVALPAFDFLPASYPQASMLSPPFQRL